MNAIQQLVDALADRLARPVGVDDRRFRAIAYSSHSNEIDDVRRTSILGRQAPDAVTRWLEGLGVLGARDVVRVPANAEFGMVARVCVPVRFRDRLLGLLWLTEQHAPLADEELATARRFAVELGQELYRDQQKTDAARTQEAAWVDQAVGEGPAGPDPRLPGIAADAVYAVLVVRIAFPDDDLLPAGLDVRLIDAMEQLRRSVEPRHQLASVDGAGATVVVSANGAAAVERHAEALHAAVAAEVSDAVDAAVVVGVGDLADAAGGLAVAAGEARRAAGLGLTMPALGPVVLWSRLGVVRLLTEILDERDPGAFIPPPLRALLEDPDRELLVASLEAFLERGGDVAAAAADLYVHRSSMYNRLRRVEEVAGIDIRSGAQRLEMHLGIRLWRMAGAP